VQYTVEMGSYRLVMIIIYDCYNVAYNFTIARIYLLIDVIKFKNIDILELEVGKV